MPKFQFWKEVARQYHAVSQGDFNITKLGCKEGVDTLWKLEEVTLLKLLCMQGWGPRSCFIAMKHTHLA